MQAENLTINQRRQREVIKEVSEVVPYLKGIRTVVTLKSGWVPSSCHTFGDTHRRIRRPV